MSDTAGRSTALNLYTPLRRGGRIWAGVLFGASKRIRQVTDPLRAISFIHFAKWSVVDRLPGDPRKLQTPVLLFESNFDVPLARYVDAFAYVLTQRMRAVWCRAHGYPGLLPTDQFTQWVQRNSIESDYYYCAYPDATTNMVRAGLAVRDRLTQFAAEQRGEEESDDEFARAYLLLLTDLQVHL